MLSKLSMSRVDEFFVAVAWVNPITTQSAKLLTAENMSNN